MTATPELGPWAKRSLTDPAHPGHSTHTVSTDGWKAIRAVAPYPVGQRIRQLLTGIAAGHAHEMCGFLSTGGSDGTEIQYLLVPNVHERPHINFYMHEEKAIEALQLIYDYGQECLGIFHTHPANTITWPSPRDILGWPNPDLEWRYWIATPHELVEWELVR